jgi:hypothetical protein
MPDRWKVKGGFSYDPTRISAKFFDLIATLIVRRKSSVACVEGDQPFTGGTPGWGRQLLHSDRWVGRPQGLPQCTTGSHSGVCILPRAGNSRGLANSVDLSGSHDVDRSSNESPLTATVLMYVAGCGSKLCKRPERKGPSRLSTNGTSAIEQM